MSESPTERPNSPSEEADYIFNEDDEGEEEDEDEEEEENEEEQLEEEQLLEEEEPFVSIFEILDAPRELPDPIDLTLDQVRQIQSELGIITLCWPDIENPEFEKRAHFPESYVRNNDKEKLLLLYTENFRRQMVRLYPNRKPLFLASPNEVGLMKMVCTTIRPTTLPYPEIETWQDCASFVGDQLKYEPLETPTLLPNRLYSPHTIFIRQSGHSFELATALCSLLLGLGYDAYVVSGYAVQDVCLKIMTRVNSPFPPEEEKEEEVVKPVIDQKYILRPAKDLRSQFLLAMAQREIDKVNEEKRIIAEEEQKRLEELEKPPYDPLYGLRLHSWVLILAGEKDVETSIFIEPSTGSSHPTDSSLYCGIESIWNNNNYWDCSHGLGNLEYDFYDLEKWEHFLIGEPLKWRESKFADDMEEDEIQLLTIMDEKHLDMPSPWSLRICIPYAVLQKRFPNGVRKTWFKRTMVEQFAPYVQEDGLLTRICRYNDLECSSSELHTIEERYENRNDNLSKIISDCVSGTITEHYKRGREDAVKLHSYKSGHNTSVESERIIEFYHEARYDGLGKLELDPLFLIEHYVNQEDFIYYRHTSFAKRGEPPPGMTESVRRIVVKIVEKYHRNEKKQASKDIAVREFAIIEREIHLKYHYEEGKVTASTRDFIKPSLAEMGDQLKFNPNLTVGYQAEIGAKPPRQLQLFLLFEQQLNDEDKTLYHIREMEDQVLEFLKLRSMEAAFPRLSISLFDREHNYKYKQGLQEREQKEKEIKERETEDEIDYLAPYICRLGSPSKLTQLQSNQAREWCQTEFKQMLIDRANDIQLQFEKETVRLQEKQAWYVSVQDTLDIDEEARYYDEVNESIFYLHSLELRLARHRDLSPYRYEALVNFLKMDPRLRPYK